MKKFVTMFFVLFIIAGLLIFSPLPIGNMNGSTIKLQLPFTNEQRSIEEPNEELYERLFNTLIYPDVEKAIAHYYFDYFTRPPTEDLWSYKVLNIKKVDESIHSYILTLEVKPYFGPHLTVGIDHITIIIDLDGVHVQEFKHIESHELPPYYQDIIKNEWPL